MRDLLAENIKKMIFGPLSGINEKISFKPLNLYTTGILYPQSESNIPLDTTVQFDNTEDTPANSDEDESENPENLTLPQDKSSKMKDSEDDDIRNENDDDLKLATNFSPSSMGFSFLISEGDEFKLTYSLGRYKLKKEKDSENNEYLWNREHYEDTLFCKSQENKLIIGDEVKQEVQISDEVDFKPKLSFFVRNLSNESKIKLVTISLINSLVAAKKDKNCIYQPQIIVNSNKSIFHPFPDKTSYHNLTEDYEALNNALLYRDYNVYAMGHGISVNWHKTDTKSVNCIQTEIMPEENVFGVDVDRKDVLGNAFVLEMKYLAGTSLNIGGFNETELFEKLEEFINKYKNWIKEQEETLNKTEVNDILKNHGKNNLKQCFILYERLYTGIKILKDNPIAKQAFYDANSAMFIQRILGQYSSWRRDKQNIIPGTEGYKDVKLPDFINLPSNGQQEDEYNFGFIAKWRPFQLAFLLSQIEGIVDPESKDRDTTDLIWFPTGGGKTEAYLGLIAFTLFYRRLKEDTPDKGAGVSVLMRYTLRMLNLDQFQRANVLISACEIIRKNNEQKYGKSRFTSGIWVGQSLTPNRFDDTDRINKDGFNSNIKTYIENIEQDRNDKLNFSPFLSYCPCCGNSLLKQAKAKTGEWGYFRKYRSRDGLNQPKGNYAVSCTNKECHFFTIKDTRSGNFEEDRLFPFYTVDEEIYTQRPSLLFGTVDKYAQIAWKKESANLFNFDSDNNNIRLFPGPDLIIQDELHLIGSSLGTIYGLFEFAVDKLISHEGVKPKIVGATATVKNASIQCRRLYSRTQFMQFPPPAISADDSFYMKKNLEDKKPRKYIGFMSSGFTSSTSIIRLASILIETPNILPVKNEDLDKYFTLLVYFNSLKELGKFRTFIDDDIYAYRKFLDNTVINKIHQNLSGRDIELSSAMSADDITVALEHLKKLKLKPEINQDKILDLLESIGIRSYVDWLETTNKKFILSKQFMLKLGLTYADDYKTNKQKFERLLEAYFAKEYNAPVKIATATNMIATGVDISRLNLMVINGHPKSSSEYIQASSRVGREDAGLILSFYSATKNRDRSHYENYKAFHQAFYKYVEPASVTPHSLPALEKIIPSIIISLVWILYRKSSTQSFEFCDEIELFISEIKQEIIKRLGDETKDYIDPVINGVIEKWRNFNPSDRRFSSFHDYIKKSRLQTLTSNEVFDVPSDLAELRTAQHLIPKVSTMRDVEPSCNVKLSHNE